MDEYEEGQFGQVAHMVGVLSKRHGENKTNQTKNKSNTEHILIIKYDYTQVQNAMANSKKLQCRNKYDKYLLLL